MTISSRASAGPIAADTPFRSVVAGCVRFLADLRSQADRARFRSELRRLGDQQLADSGIDRSAIGPARIEIEIEAGVMRKLMSMR